MHSNTAFSRVPSSVQPATSTTLTPIGRYRPLLRLGRGGMAEVFLSAWEVAPGVRRAVVVKRLHAHLSDDPGLLQMFSDEARLACRLEHEFIVRTLETAVIDGSCCIVMEYLEGQPLHRVLRRAFELGTLPIALAVHVTISVLRALEYAHAATDHLGASLGIVHRDISPHNVFVSSDGRVKVLDFGIAKANSHEGHTATGFIKGKIGYIAPEQAMSEDVDLRADLFSAGVLLWEALVGARLFKADTDAATLRLTLQEEIPRVVSRRADVPEELDQVLVRALARSPEERYQTASAMREALEAFLVRAELTPTDADLKAELDRLFGSEIADQRRLVQSLLSKTEAAPSSYQAPASTGAVVLPTGAAVEPSSSGLRAEVRSFRTVAWPWLIATSALLAICAFLLTLNLTARHADTATPGAAPVAAVVPAPPVAVAQEAPRVALAAAPVAAVAQVAPVPAAVVAPSALAPVRFQSAARRPEQKAALSASTAALPSADPERFGFLTIDSSPWSTVLLGGRALGVTPLVGVRLPAGTHTVQLKNAELGLEAAYTVQVEAGKTTARRVGLK